MLNPRRLANRLAHRLVHGTRGWAEHVGAIGPTTPIGREFGSLGADACISFPPTTLYGTRSIHIGSGTMIGRHCTLSVGYGPDAVDLPPHGLVIGDRCVIGARSVLTAHESIVIGDDVWFGQDVFVSDASHGYQDPTTPIGLQLGEHQPVSIGAGSWVGHGAIILPGTRIGRNVVVAAGSVVRGEVPDHAVVGGVPAKVVRRLEPGIGWVPTSGAGEVRAVWSQEDLAELYAQV